MASNPLLIKTPSQIADEYLANLKVLRPAINTDQKDSDWWVRGQVTGGTVAGAYADVRKTSNDAFPQSARHEALEQHLIFYFGSGFIAATQSQGNVSVSGTSGAAVSGGQVFTHTVSGNQYKAVSGVILAGPTGTVPVISILTGQNQNINAGSALTLSPPPVGINAAAVVLPSSATNPTSGLTDARDDETDEEAATRILLRVRNKLRGGAIADYKQWAIESDPSVVSSNVIRFPFGLGTVLVVISAGTTDIDTAIDTGTTVSLLPSNALLSTVLNHIRSVNPLTDCVSVSGPNVASIDVTAKVRFASGTVSTIIPTLGITQGAAVVREINRAIYKTPIGGYLLGGNGFVVLSQIEDTIDSNLAANGIITGLKQQITIDRLISNLAASGANRMILPTEIALPGTITVTDF